MSIVPLGSILVHRYYRAPRDINPGDAHDDLASAVTDALRQWADLAGDFPVYPPVVDEIWVMVEPSTGGRHHTVHQRSTIAPHLTQGDQCRTQAERRAVADTLSGAAADAAADVANTAPPAARS